MIETFEQRTRRLTSKKKYYERNKEAHNQKSREYYKNNRERINALSRTYNREHKEEAKARGRAWREANAENLLVNKKAYRDAHREEINAYQREWKRARHDTLFVAKVVAYGATVEQAEIALAITACESCGDVTNLHIDHCHQSQTYRGMLCRQCNTALGYFRENLIALKRSQIYLKETPHTTLELLETPIGVCPVCDRNLTQQRRAQAKLKYCSPECKEEARRIRRKGLAIPEYRAWLRLQANLCEICRIEFREEKYKGPYIDHCHNTSRVRGLLCLCCNLGLGLLKDDPTRIQSLILYLQERGKNADLSQLSAA